jgi:HAD superfamily hydrolase (TIGR01459 family)
MPQSARQDLPGVGWAMRINGVSEIAGQFDAMLIDQFGVIHDGEKLYPGTLRVLTELRALKIPVVVMTNSGKRARANCERLLKMGVPRGCFVEAVSSGEVAYNSIKVSRAYVIGKDGENYGFDSIVLVDTPQQADVILILGSNAPATSLGQYRALLEGVSIPAFCCNPDKLMLTPQGLQPAPGAIAALYEQMGGKVTWIGKPYPEIYRRAAELAGNPKRILCIGDSAEHDVAGGRSAGFATLLVMTGVSAGHDPAALAPQPDYWMESFTW